MGSDRMRIVEAYLKGATFNLLAKHYGTSPYFVKKVILEEAPDIIRRKRYGERVRRKDADESNRRILAAHLAGETLTQIGRKEGISRQYVWYLLRQMKPDESP